MGEHGHGSTGDSNFLFSEYDDMALLAANETNSWDRDHSYNNMTITANGKY